MSCVSRAAIYLLIIDQLLSAKSQLMSPTRMDTMTSGCKNKQHIRAKRTHTAQHQMLVPLWGGNKSARGE